MDKKKADEGLAHMPEEILAGAAFFSGVFLVFELMREDYDPAEDGPPPDPLDDDSSEEGLSG